MTDELTILDGGVGSELRRRGIALDAIAWSATVNLVAADRLTDIHVDYIRAGADVITANTFANARFVLDAAGVGDRFRDANVAAIDAARRAIDMAGANTTLAASLSCFPPGYDAAAYPDPATELDAYRELVTLFAELGVELVVLEMMQDTTHAPLACRAADECGLPWWLGISCRVRDRDAEDAQLSAYDAPSSTLDEVLDVLLAFEPCAVNVMHTPVDTIVPALNMVRSRWHGRLGAYAEIPYPEDPDRSGAVRMSSADYARVVPSWLELGITIVGGCCGTTPAHIAALAAAVKASESD